MRVLAALVLILAAILIGMAARGDFSPDPSPVVRVTARPSPASTTAVPRATGPRTVTLTPSHVKATGQDFGVVFPLAGTTATNKITGHVFMDFIGTTGGVPLRTVYIDANNNGKLDSGELSTTVALLYPAT